MEDSPCTGVCTLEDGVCIACDRTIEEIANWPSDNDE